MQEKNANTAAGMALFVILALPCAALPQFSQQQAQEENKDAEKKQDEHEAKKTLTKLYVKVTAGEQATPIQAAQVDVTSEEEGVNYHRIVRTDRDGKADLDVPRGKVLVQVTAQHWDTGGTRCKLKEQEEKVEINLVKRKQPAG